MSKATYYFADGTGALVPVSCDADKDGTLKRDGEVIVTGATATEVPTSGSYVLAAAPAPKKLTKKEQEEAEAKRLADEAEAEAQRLADEAEAKRLEEENPPLIP